MQVGVLLFHGMAGSPGELRYVQNALQRAGYRVSIPIINGLACGTDVSRLSTWQDWCKSAVAEYDKLATRCDKVVVGGLSVGAVLAIAVAQARPSCAAMLLLSPTLKVNGWSIPWTFKLFTLVQQKSVARLFNFAERQPFGIKDERIRAMAIQALRAETGLTNQQIFSVNGSLFLEIRRMKRGIMRVLSTVTCPALIAHPRHDDQSDLNNAFKLQNALGGPVISIVLEDSYHVITLDRQRSVLVDSILNFLNVHVRNVDSYVSGFPGQFDTRDEPRLKPGEVVS